MSEYTPTTGEIRDRWGKMPHLRAEFDRWLAAHDGEKRAEWEAERDAAIRQRVPNDAEFITYIDSYAARLYAQRAVDGVRWLDGGGRIYQLEELPGVTDDVVFTVLDVRADR